MRWWLRPRVVFSALAVIIIVAILVAPPQDVGTDEPHLTTYSRAPNGASGVHDLARRLGWPVERRLDAFRTVLDSTVVYAVLAPPVELTAGEVGMLMTAVRAGAGLIALPRADTPLADSLGMRRSRRAFAGVTTSSDPHYAELYDLEVHHVLEVTRPLPADTSVLLRGWRPADQGGRPIVVVSPVGRGRVVALADPRLLMNDVVRDSGKAVLPVRVLEAASRASFPTVVFAEFHQGFGRHASLTRTLARGFVETGPGRALGVLCVAAVLLLLALGARPVPPRPRLRIERRSALEHVSALARAYEEAGATRTVTRHLLRGLRRRRITGHRALSDADLLRGLAGRHPAVAPAVESVLAARDQKVSPERLLEVGRAVATIERTIYE